LGLVNVSPGRISQTWLSFKTVTGFVSMHTVRLFNPMLIAMYEPLKTEENWSTVETWDLASVSQINKYV